MEEIKHLEDYHVKKLSDEAFLDYAAVLKNFTRLEQTIQEWKYRHSPMDKFPSISELSALDFELRVKEWNKLKKTEPTVEDLQRSTKTSHGKEALAGMIAFQEGKMNRQGYLDWMAAMDKKHPSMGWAEQGKELEKVWSTEKERYAKSYTVRKHMATIGNPPRPWMIYDWEK